tara:strand:+ start:1901 stop:2254 length:354 start_codon:yes stop_codon:yes gene_type:complete
MGDNIYCIESLKDFDKILNKHKCVILKAGADWCGPCKVIEPLFGELISMLENDIGIVKINIDNAVEIKRKFKITKIPYMANFFNKEITDIINTSNKEMIRKFINKTIDKYDMFKKVK